MAYRKLFPLLFLAVIACKMPHKITSQKPTIYRTLPARDSLTIPQFEIFIKRVQDSCHCKFNYGNYELPTK